MTLSRARLQQLAETRIAEARALLVAGHDAGAYYLAGYAVELGLKACIAKQFVADEIPDWAFTRELRTHLPQDLLRIAGLSTDLRARKEASAEFDRNWQLVLSWRVDSRYDIVSAKRAADFVNAVDDPQHGVVTWMRTYW